MTIASIHADAIPDPRLIESDARTLECWLMDGGAVVVDVREAGEFAAEHIEGSALFPLSGYDLGEFPANWGLPVVLVCAIGVRSAKAGNALLRHGHKQAIHLKGGLEAWKQAGFETARAA